MLLFGDEDDQDDMRSKNIRQTGMKDQFPPLQNGIRI
jgi:hypothetical protein